MQQQNDNNAAAAAANAAISNSSSSSVSGEGGSNERMRSPSGKQINKEVDGDNEYGSNSNIGDGVAFGVGAQAMLPSHKKRGGRLSGTVNIDSIEYVRLGLLLLECASTESIVDALNPNVIHLPVEEKFNSPNTLLDSSYLFPDKQQQEEMQSIIPVFSTTFKTIRPRRSLKRMKRTIESIIAEVLQQGNSSGINDFNNESLIMHKIDSTIKFKNSQQRIALLIICKRLAELVTLSGVSVIRGRVVHHQIHLPETTGMIIDDDENDEGMENDENEKKYQMDGNESSTSGSSAGALNRRRSSSRKKQRTDKDAITQQSSSVNMKTSPTTNRTGLPILSSYSSSANNSIIAKLRSDLDKYRLEFSSEISKLRSEIEELKKDHETDKFLKLYELAMKSGSDDDKAIASKEFSKRIQQF